MNLKHTGVVSLALFFTFFVFTAQATQYQTVQSGLYSSVATWKNSAVPPTVLGAGDTVLFYGPNALHITLDRDIIMSDSSCMVHFFSNIRMTEAGKHFIAAGKGTFLQDAGSAITIDSFYLSGDAGIYSNISGADTFKKLTLSAAGLQGGVSATLMLRELLHIKDGVCTLGISTILSNGVQNPPVIHYANGGNLVADPLVLPLYDPYSLKYSYSTTRPEQNRFNELAGTGGNVTSLIGIEVTNNADVVLVPELNNIKLRGDIQLTSGTLSITDSTAPFVQLIFRSSGRFGSTGTGTLSGSDSLEIEFQTYDTNVPGLGWLRFTPGKNRLKALRMILQMTAPTRLVLFNDLTVNELDLQKGYVYMQGHTLDVANSAGVTNGSSVSYVMMDAGGSLRVHASGPLAFPIGSSVEYLPVKATFSKPVNRIGVDTVVRENGTTGTNVTVNQPAVAATWTLYDSTTAQDMTAGWSTASERNGFDRNNCFITNYTNTAWDSYTKGASTYLDFTHWIERKGSFTPGVYAVFDVNTRVSVEELISGKDVSLYPNPATDMLHFSYPGNVALRATVSDVSGKVLLSNTIHNGDNRIDISALQSGLYFLDISGSGISSMKKFMKK